MPPLFIAKDKALFLQINRCKGCHYCIEVCPAHALTPSSMLNRQVQYPPQIADGQECRFCGTCELLCPDFAIYIVNKSELGINQ
ncbi:MAG: 4Fe-4S binding protein [Candidatus Helarchaeota archaeon]